MIEKPEGLWCSVEMHVIVTSCFLVTSLTYLRELYYSLSCYRGEYGELLTMPANKKLDLILRKKC